MQDTTIMKIALIVSILGLLMLAAVSNYLSPDYQSANKLKDWEIIKTKGTITNIKDAKNAVIIEIIEEKKTDVLVYKPKGMNLSVGNQIEIIGRENDGIISADNVRVID